MACSSACFTSTGATPARYSAEAYTSPMMSTPAAARSSPRFAVAAAMLSTVSVAPVSAASTAGAFTGRGVSPPTATDAAVQRSPSIVTTTAPPTTA